MLHEAILQKTRQLVQESNNPRQPNNSQHFEGVEPKHVLSSDQSGYTRQKVKDEVSSQILDRDELEVDFPL